MNRKLACTLLLLAALSTGCGAPQTHAAPDKGRPVFTSDQFQLTPGQSWDMQANNGDRTHFETLSIAQTGCEAGELLDLHITKQSVQDYWKAGLDGAEIHWVMRKDAAGNWSAVTSLIDWNPAVTSDLPHTVDYVLGGSDAYLVVPAVTYSSPQTRTGYAQWWMDYTAQTNGCLQNVGTKGSSLRWTVKLSVQNVTTPAYSGPALLNEEFEGCTAAQETSATTACPHELWYFAPGIGLVEIDKIDKGIVIKRI